MVTEDLAVRLRAALDTAERLAREAGDEVVEWIGDDAAEHGEPDCGAHIKAWKPSRASWVIAYLREVAEKHAPRPIVDPDGKERPDWPERVCRLCDPRWMGTPDWAKGEDFVPPEPEYCDELRRVAEFWLGSTG